MSNTVEILEQNWEDVKNEIRKHWRKLSEKDVKEIVSYKDLVKRLKSTYDLTEEEVQDKIDQFIDKYNLSLNTTHLDAIKNAIFSKVGDATAKASETFKTSIDTIQDKTEDWTNFLTTYTKENPLKALGLGVIAGVAIKKLLVNKAEKD